MPSTANNDQYYRYRPTVSRRTSPGEPGTLRQQFQAIDTYLSAQADERRTGLAAKRLWTVCHAIATDQPIHRGRP